MSQADDWDLLRRASSEDAAVFGELVRRHFDAGVAFVMQLLKDHQRAEEVVQRGFVNVYQARARFEPRAKFRTLLFRVLRNLSLNELNRRTTSVKLSDLEASENATSTLTWEDASSPDPSFNLEHEEGQRLLRQAMDQLRPDHRAALFLREHEELGYQEIADSLGATLAEVKIWIHRARKQIAEQMRPYIEHGERLP